ncbi:LysE family translocator [Allokutzneria albata]|uniref:Threonine/homoserine/homoserine lactone efflux protein n=1 Tax=Allokutzneria albata TaxID=211114 RepID=A0A1G9V7E9_ALLAB|nr:LysE family transporter [Allokutzneria albata]SDM68128.1 Threonine/homoserine/homoserine lactone efflux protein [Allokutzneria albata]
MAISSVTAFWAVSVLLVLVPGADWAYTISAGLQDRSVVPAVGGLLLGYVGLTAVVAAGVAAIVASTPFVLTALTSVGALYLVWIGVTTLARPAVPGADVDPAGGATWLTRVLKGAGISGLNPKALLLFLALLPQFTNPAWGWPLAAQIGTLGVVHTLTCAAVYLCVGVLARAVLRARPAAARVVSRISGAAMVLIGVLLLVNQ